MMRIAYFCPRINHLKMFGPVIAEQRRRSLGGPPLVFVPGPPLLGLGSKAAALGAWPRLGEVRAQLGAGVEVVPVTRAAELLERIGRARVGAVVSVGLRLDPAIVAGVMAPSRRAGTLWCALGHVQEELLDLLLPPGPAVLGPWDLATTLSRDGLDFVTALLRRDGVTDVAPLRRMVPVGFVELDQVREFDRAELRRRYGLAPDRPVVYLSTAGRFDRRVIGRSLPPRIRLEHAPIRLLEAAFFGRVPRALARAGLAPWRRRWPDLDHLTSYRDVLAAVRRFARRHDAVVVAKTRAKHRDPAWVARAVDHLLPDGAFFPFRTLELMALADVYVGLSSSSAIEAAFIGLPMVHVLPFPPDAYEAPSFLPVREEFYLKPGGVWNTPGLATAFHTYRAREWRAFVEWSEAAPLPGPVDPAARRAVVRRLLGEDDCNASGRFLDLVEVALERGRAAPRGEAIGR